MTFELAPTYITASGTYTIATVQQLPAAYATGSLNPAVLNTVTFTIAPGFSVNGTVGTVK